MAPGEDTITFTTLIIWATPAVFGLATWGVVQYLTEIKDDVKDLKKSNSLLRTDQAKHSVKIDTLDSKIVAVCKSVEGVRSQVHDMVKGQVGKPELELTMQAVKQIESRMNEQQTNYGKILLILNGMAKRIGIDIQKKTGTDT